MSRAAQLAAFADREPDNVALLCDLLDALIASGEIDAARARLTMVPPAVRGVPGVRFREARCALMLGETTVAIALLQALLDSVDTPPAGVVHDLAVALLAHGKPKDALQILANVHATGEDAVAVALLNARIFHRLQQCEAALEALSSVDGGPRAAEVQGLRALLWLDLGDTGRAALAADAALQLDPHQHEAGIAKGTAALWSQHLDESIASFERVLAHHPDSGRAWLGLGQTHMLRGDVPTARMLIERAAQQMPDHIGTWHALAWCQLLQGDVASTKQSLDRAFVLDRSFGETHGGFALVHALRGERVEAQASIKRATRLDPNGRSARYAQSVLAMDEGRPDEARRIIDGILAQTPGVHAIPADFIFRLRELVQPKS